MSAPDQTNAEVSDERLREPNDDLIALAQTILANCTGDHEHDVRNIADGLAAVREAAELNRRSVTSQASEGEGWVYFNEDSGEEYSPSHPVESGECEDATDIRRSTPQEDHLWAALQEEFQRAEALAVAPVSKRVERLEAALKDAEAELFEAEDKFWVAHCNYPNTTKPSFAAERQGQDKAFLATMSDRMKAARERARQALQGGRS